ncbi:peptide/nickel transport system permease protein [Streptomyces sp. LamerLS-316]|uniref:ABC transporter permease n=1 Tax=unclassified Streptomyces TaxID=2593676 RepID=UPI000823E074|nr:MULTISPECIES: ABC transporter permease [unclassified Streptomyces]MYQ36933.1 ABC transporter permease subunit [Streptomyces sp. SID4921]SCK51910.1 peptide/nickel transport system permease protein [Streptomyces sp. LamerLS-316]
MVTTAGKRVARGLLVILLVTIAAQALLSLAPGSMAQGILGQNATAENVAALNAELGLDEPAWQQYVHWLGGALHGDLGDSLVSQQPVLEAVVDRLPVTFELAFLGMAIAMVTATAFAVIGASDPGGRADRSLNALTSVFLSTPGFIAGPLLVYFFAMSAHLFPVLGWAPLGQGLGANLQSAFLPALAIAIQEIAALHRLLRTDLISTLGEDYIAAARARGMGRLYVMFRHAFRPSSFSLITVLGINLGRLLGGTVIVEVLFSLPGVGGLLVQSITSRDIVMVQGVVAFVATVYVVMNLLVDFSYGLLDPRVRKVMAA